MILIPHHVLALASLLGASQLQQPPLPRYDLSVRLVPERHRIELSGTIRVPPSWRTGDSVGFVLDRSTRCDRWEVVEPASLSGALRVDSVRASGRDIRWQARLRTSAPTGQPVVIGFSCAAVSEQPGLLFYPGGPVVYASGWGTNWYPGLGDGSVRAQGAMRVQTPPTHPTVLASGSRLIARDSAAGTWDFELSVPAYFSVLAGAFHPTRKQGDIPVTVYTLEARPGAAEQARVAAATVAILQQEFGRYRMNELAIVEYPDSLARGLGFNAAGEPGLLVLKGGFLHGPPSIANYAHELGHNWWPMVTTFAPPQGLMVEGLANYAAFRVIEELEGPAAAELFRRRGDPGFNGEISAEFYLKHAAAGFDTTLVAMREGMYPQRNMAGIKGAYAFDMLAAEVGRPAFRRALAAILTRHEWSQVALRDLIREIGRNTGRELDWFYEQWFTRPGAPRFALSWQATGTRVTGSISQAAAPWYRVSLPLRFSSADSGAVTRVLKVDGPRTDFDFRMPFAVSEAAIDPGGRTFWWPEEVRIRMEALAPLTRAEVRRSAEEFRKALPLRPHPDLHGYEFTAHLGIARLFMDSGPADSARTHLQQALMAPTRDPMQLSLAYALLAVLADRAGDSSGVRWAVARSISADAKAGIPGASVWARNLLRPIK